MSTSTSSPPTVPSTARKLTVNRRVINVKDKPVQADMSADTSNGSSFDISLKENTAMNSSSSAIHHPEAKVDRNEREITPVQGVSAPWYPGPDGIGKKGILRPVGTPGSGNGVRFFPKNRFRVITPNQTITTPEKPPPSPSFLSQLLSVSFPIISSPRPKLTNESPKAHNNADESWEVPGQEGEVSLLSAASFPSETSISQIEVMEEESWHGEPQVICSPLALPSEFVPTPSREASFQELELPSAEWRLPELSDMSNLLSTRMSPPPGNSFSMDMQRQRPLRYDKGPEESKDDSVISSNDSSREDDNPTIRRRLSPIPDSPSPVDPARHPENLKQNVDEVVTTMPSTPLPFAKIQSSLLAHTQSPSPAEASPISTSKPFSSIFADMSAEQANFVWPVSRRSSDIGVETVFHSAILGDMSVAPTASPGKQSQPGEITQYYDFSVESLSPTPSPGQQPSLSHPLNVQPSTTSNTGLVQTLIQPSQILFQAQESHTTALKQELTLHRNLATKLQSEVAERDGVLAGLKIRLLEEDMLRNQVEDLRRELLEINMTKAKSVKTSADIESSPSPSPFERRRLSGPFHDHPGDRTSTSQAEMRDLEIRLKKSLLDIDAYSKLLDQAREEGRTRMDEVEKVKEEMRVLSDMKKDGDVRDGQTRLDVEREKEEIQQKYDDLVLEVETLRSRLANQEAVGEESARTKEDILDRNDQLQAELDEIYSLKAEYEDFRSEAVDRQQELKYDLDEALQRGLDLALKVESLESRLQDPSHSNDGKHIDAERDELLDRVADLEREICNLKQVKGSFEAEIEKLEDIVKELEESKGKEADLMADIAELKRAMEAERLGREAAERRIVELGSVSNSDQELKNAIQSLQDELSTVQIQSERSIQSLEDENAKLRASLSHLQSTQVSPFPSSTSTSEEILKLRAEINRLRSESSSKDLEIVTLQKRKIELKEDREMLNVALDSKQQEVELMKRKFQVRGIAGSTPLGPSTKANIPSLSSTSRRQNATPMTKSNLVTPAPYRRTLSSSTTTTNRVYGYTTPADVLGSVREKGRGVMGMSKDAGRVNAKTQEERHEGVEGRVEMLVSSVQPRRSRRTEAMLA